MGGDRLAVAALVVFAAFAVMYALVTDLRPHREWAIAAAAGYLVAALLVRHSRRLAGAALLLGTLAVPLVWEVVGGVANPEIGILRVAAQRWLASGTPFPDLAGGGDPNAYNVYLPGLALFGMPSALFGAGPATDPRLFLVVASVLLFALVGARWPAVLLLSCPFVALQLVAGATDVPVLGCLCVALLCADRRRIVTAGAFAGFAAGMKAFAWPGLVVLLVFVCARSGARAGLRCAGACLVLAAALLVPVVLADPHAFLVNAIELPLGGLPVRLTAGSPLPGHVLAGTVPGGSTVAAALLGLAAAAIGVLLLRRPPRDAVSAARWLALGLVVAILLAPSSRYGYLVYPAGLLFLPYLTRPPWPVPAATRADQSRSLRRWRC